MASIPVALLHDAKGTIVTAELDSGEYFRGQLTAVDDNMNIELKQVTHTNPWTKESREVPTVFLRGSTLTFFQLAPSLASAPSLVAAEGLGNKAGFAAPPERRGFGTKGKKPKRGRDGAEDAA